MTSLTHQSGTDRIAEVAHVSGWEPRDVVVNLQGDEPLMPAALVVQVAAVLESREAADIATLASRINSLSTFLDPNVVKVVTDATGKALYFSRAPIPWSRDTAAAGVASQRAWTAARRHIGLYAYRVDALRRLSMSQPSLLEQIEKLEQLRALEDGMSIHVEEASVAPGPDVNTQEDLLRVERLLMAARDSLMQVQVNDVAHAIQLSLAPVFLLNGVGVLLSMLTSRLARIVDRARQLEIRLMTATAEESVDMRATLATISRRARLMNRSITLGTVTALLVAAVVALLFATAFLSFPLGSVIALVFILAMLCLVGSLWCFLIEIRVSTLSLRFGITVNELNSTRRPE